MATDHEQDSPTRERGDDAASPNSDSAPQNDVEHDSPTRERGDDDAPSKSFLSEYGRIVLYALFIALFLKVFFVEAFGIPTPSMRDTLKVGDFLFVNKFLYGIRTPRAVPLTGIRLPHMQILPGYTSPSRGDVIVFEYPGDRSTVEQPNVLNYVKRCIALPGDTVEIAGKRVFVNGERQGYPEHAVIGSRTLGPGDFDHDIYPKGSGYNRDWWGPMVVPCKGMEIELGLENIDQWRLFIEREGHTVRFTAEGTVQVDGYPDNIYTVENDYYFMLGDKRDDSEDSRYWGFVPEQNIVGKAMFIYWSWDSRIPVTSPISLVESIRWDRIFSVVH